MSKIMRGFMSLFVGMMGVVTVAGMADAEDGKANFGKNCVVCHGVDGKGKPGLSNSDLTVKDLTKIDPVKSITNGKPGTSMLAWKGRLSAKDIAAVAAYVKTLKK